MAGSPYKKFKTTNRGWIGYINISKLEKDIAYKIETLSPTNHTQYGSGEQASIVCHDGKRWRTQLPGKYLAKLTPAELTKMKENVKKNEFPYLIFREIMMDNSYRVDVIEKCPKMDEKFSKKEAIPELEDSVTEDVDGSGDDKTDDSNPAEKVDEAEKSADTVGT